MSSTYYQELHDKEGGYQQNNWLVAELDRALACSPRSLVEIGCGNGRFLRLAAPYVETATGLDWAVSPLARGMPQNVTVLKTDITKAPIPSADLVCSADVLEHFLPDSIAALIGKLDQAGRFNFHVIACYDDNHSHLTIWEPEVWLDAFRSISRRYELVGIRTRRDDPSRQSCVIANF